MVKIIKGDITKAKQKVILHGVNCQGVMGSGVAKALYTKWPKVKTDYLSICDEEFADGRTPDQLLGLVQPVRVTKTKKVLNCFTQQNYGYDKQVYLNYDALITCLSSVSLHCFSKKIKEIAMPKIGCGLAGGDWEKVKKIVERIFGNITVYVYEL